MPCVSSTPGRHTPRTPSLPRARAQAGGALRPEVAVARGLGWLETIPWRAVLPAVCPPSESGSGQGGDAQGSLSGRPASLTLHFK